MIKRLLPHICLILSGFFLVLCVIDYFNSAMQMIDNEISKTMLFCFAAVSLVTSLILIRSHYES